MVIPRRSLLVGRLRVLHPHSTLTLVIVFAFFFPSRQEYSTAVANDEVSVCARPSALRVLFFLTAVRGCTNASHENNKTSPFQHLAVHSRILPAAPPRSKNPHAAHRGAARAAISTPNFPPNSCDARQKLASYFPPPPKSQPPKLKVLTISHTYPAADPPPHGESPPTGGVN